MTEQSIFLAALEIDDPAARADYLDKACAGNDTLRQEVRALFAAHERSGDFLNVPAVEQIGAAASPIEGGTATFSPEAQKEAVRATKNNGQRAGHTSSEDADDDEESTLHFLQPSSRPGSMGRLGHYEVLEVLGRGGFGIVVKALDERLQRVVAIKLMSAQLAATSPARKRFLREARSSASVRHEHVVAIHDIAEQPIPYLVMEYIAGETLQQKLDRIGPLEVAEVLRLGKQIADGLAAAHAMGLIHRDIKPSNILLESGVEQRVKITDFGLARAADDASLTQSGVIAGTPMYMAPEQAQGDAIDQRADLFSLGSVLYVMCSGRPPFRASTTLAVLKRVAEDTPRPIREIIPEVPEWLCAIVEKLHAKKPDERFQTAREVAELLGQHLVHERQPNLVPMPARVRPPINEVSGSAVPSRVWKQIFAATDHTKRRVQLGLIVLGILLILTPYYVLEQPWRILAVLAGFMIFAAGGAIKQRCAVAYKGHRIRFENSGFAGKLFIDGMLVGRGRLRSWEDLCAVIPGGSGAGEQIRVSADANLGAFRCQIFAAEGLARPAKVETPPKPVSIRRSRWPRVVVPVVLLLLAVCAVAWFSPTATRYLDNRAEVEFTPEAGLTSVIVLQNDASVTDWMDMKTGRTIQLSPGKYRINHGFSKPGLDLRWEVTRHGLFASQKSMHGGHEFELEVQRGERITVHPVISPRRETQAASLNAVPQLIKAFTTADKTLNYAFPDAGKITIEDGGWKIVSGGRGSTQIFNIGTKNMQKGMLIYRAKMKSANLPQNAYLCLHVMLGNELVVCPTSQPISGVSDWATFESYYAMDENHIPDSATLTVAFDSRGTVWLKDVEVLYLPAPGVPEPGWVSLFNGKDLTGWKNHPDQPGEWKIENGMLVGRAPMGLLYSERGDYGDFDLHIEAKVNDGGDGGIYLRTPEFPPSRKLWTEDPKGHRVVLSANSKHDPLFKTGSLKTWRPTQDYLVQACDRETSPDQWFTLDVLARGPDIVVRVNGKKTAQLDGAAKHDVSLKGFLVLEAKTEGSVIHIRKIEIKERTTAVTNN